MNFLLQESGSKILQQDGTSGIFLEFQGFLAMPVSFTVTGIPSNLTKSLHSVLSVGTFNLTGISANFTKALHAVLSVGTFTLTGINILIRFAIMMSVSAKSFTVTGIGALFHKVLHIILSVRTFTLTGFALFKGIRASVGTFIITGNDKPIVYVKQLWKKINKSLGESWNKIENPQLPTPFNKNVNLLQENGFKILQENGSNILVEVLHIPGDIWTKISVNTGKSWNKITKNTGISWEKITKSTGKVWNKIK